MISYRNNKLIDKKFKLPWKCYAKYFSVLLFFVVWIDSASSKNVTITYGNGTSQLTRLYAVHSMPEYKVYTI